MLTALALALTLNPLSAPKICAQTESLSLVHSIAPIVIHVDAANGASISGSHVFKVTVDAGDAIVTRVEEYINGQLITSQSSTPYLFTVNTLNYSDGPMTVKFVAYTDSGNQAAKILKLKVNNGLGEGATDHVTKGNQDFENGNYNQALEQGLVALKADPKSVAAKLLVARVYLLKKTYDKSQTMVEDVLGDDPKNLDALNLAGIIGVDEAFNIYNGTSSSSNALATISKALNYAVTNRKAYLNAKFDAIQNNATDSKSAIAYASRACAANHFSSAIQVLKKQFLSDASNTELANWLAYAELREGRISDALVNLGILKRTGSSSFDGYTEAIYAVLLTMSGHPNQADRSMSNAIMDDMSGLGVRTAQASIALQENKTTDLAAMLNSLLNDAGQLTEVNYLVSSLEFKTQHYNSARKYMIKSLEADPANYLMYVEAGNQVVAGVLSSNADKASQKEQYKVAKMFYQTALHAKGDSYEALTGLSIVSGFLGKPDDALSFAKAAVASQPTYAGAEYALSMAYGLFSGNKTAEKAATAATDAGNLDAANLSGVTSPSPKTCFTYFSTYGRTPVIAAPPVS